MKNCFVDEKVREVFVLATLRHDQKTNYLSHRNLPNNFASIWFSKRNKYAEFQAIDSEATL
jgi:hypothetical protein